MFQLKTVRVSYIEPGMLDIAISRYFSQRRFRKYIFNVWFAYRLENIYPITFKKIKKHNQLIVEFLLEFFNRLH
jgi:hypothetical protein